MIAVLMLLVSCGDSKLEHALRLAGDNREELQKVLDHYADDEQKLRAAFFLIENMPENALLLLSNNTRGKEERIFT